MAKEISIWIDADSCPTLVRNHVVKMGNRLNCQVYFVANKDIPCNQDGQFQMIICKKEKDSADNYIFDHVAASDLVITRDIVFAERLAGILQRLRQLYSTWRKILSGLCN